MVSREDISSAIESMAAEEGFARVGFARADAAPAPYIERFQRWLAKGFHAGMEYMARDVYLRHSPAALVPGAKSVMCLAVPYAPADGDVPGGGIARYARGRDYHKVLKGRCIRLMDRIRQTAPEFDGRAFVDSAPVMERTLAAAAGIGFIGLNGCLIVPGLGSYVVLAEIICNLDLPPGQPIPSQCDQCGRCAAACPTAAIGDDGLVDARRCISYHTIENRGEIPSEYWRNIDGHLLGCDNCQQACPHNQGAAAGGAELRGQSPPLGGADVERILRWTLDDWDAATRGSSTRRATYDMMIRNAILVAGNSGRRDLLPALAHAAAAHPQHSHLVRWAVTCIEDDE